MAQTHPFPIQVVFPEDVSVTESEAAASPFFPSEAKRSRRTMMEDLPDLSPAGRERIARFKSRKESILSILQTPKVVKKKQGCSTVVEPFRI